MDEQTPDEDTPEFMTASQARRRLGISKVTLARLIRDGVLPTTDSPLDKRVKFVRASDVAALLPFQRPLDGGTADPPHRQQHLAETPDPESDTTGE